MTSQSGVSSMKVCHHMTWISSSGALDSLLEKISMEITSKLERQDVDDSLPFTRKQCQEESVPRIPQSVL
ncbi:MAG: hypothetical protein ACFFER_17415 [Candidatus Thorarchaeota archaeon]